MWLWYDWFYCRYLFAATGYSDDFTKHKISFVFLVCTDFEVESNFFFKCFEFFFFLRFFSFIWRILSCLSGRKVLDKYPPKVKKKHQNPLLMWNDVQESQQQNKNDDIFTYILVFDVELLSKEFRWLQSRWIEFGFPFFLLFS